MHPFYDALPVPDVPVRVTSGALVAHRYTYALPLCRTSQYTAEPLFITQCPCGTIFLILLFDGVGLVGFKSYADSFLLASAARSIFVFYCFSLSILCVFRMVLRGWGHWTDRL